MTDPDDLASPPLSIKTTSEGIAEFQGIPFGPRYEFLVSLADLDAAARSEKAPTANESRIGLDLSVQGLSPDQGFADNTEVDFSNPFYPLGLQPRPGSAFYFTNEEVFSKPNAEVRIYMAPTVSPEDETTVSVNGQEPAPLDHTLVWEYWNGRQWVALLQSSRNGSPKADFTDTEVIKLTVPVDMVPTTVNDVEALWMRVRLLSGTFGFKQQVVWNSGATVSEDPAPDPTPVINVVASAFANPTNLFTYVITQPPVLANFVLGYTWEDGPKHADRVLAYNDFEHRDYTDAARWPGSAFAPYRRVDDITPALYLGFDKNFPDDRIGIYFDILEQRDDTKGPVLIWEYWNGSTWRKLSVEDETSFLRLPGIVSFIASDDSRARPRFGEDLHFVRARLQHDGPPGEPAVQSIYPNAVWASQRQTLNDVPLGASSGLPDQVFLITQTPVLAGEQIEVRELFGPRANVEWRSLALSLTGGDRSAVRDLEAMLGREGAETNFVKGKLRLRRDRNKRVAEAWVRWDGQPHLYSSEPEDRHYVIDRAAGRLLFGDGTNGRIPPPGAAILAKQFRSGGGAVGNVEARKITQMLGAVPGVEAVFNPLPAEGGADGETLEAFTRRGPQTVRHRGRAITPSDYETLAREASPAVAFVRAIPSRDAAGNRRAGRFNLLIIPQSEAPRPQPTNGLRQHVQRFIETRAPADLVGCAGISVTGPDYLPVGIDAVIAPRLPSEAGQVERRARSALQAFFHPLRGGPAGRGWELGRDVFLSDVAAVLEAVEGLDYVEELALLLNGAPQGESVKVAEDRIVVAGGIELTVRVAER